MQAAMVHLLFNVLGVIIWFPFMGYMAQWAIAISPVADPSLGEAARMMAEVPRQIANSHTIFNLVNALIFLPFVNQFAALAVKLLPVKTQTAAEAAVATASATYLDVNLLPTHAIALSMARKEAVRMGEMVSNMLTLAPQGILPGQQEVMKQVSNEGKQVDNLYNEIASYLGRLTELNLIHKHAAECMSIMTTVSELENVGDIIDVQYRHLANVAISNNLQFDQETTAALKSYHKKVADALRTALVSFEHDRLDTARSVIDMEEEIVGDLDKFNQELNRRMLQENRGGASYAVYALESDIMENLRRIYRHSRRIARLVVRQEGGEAIAHSA